MSLIKDSFLYIFGEVLSKGMPYVLLPFITNSLGVEDYGRLAYFQVIVALVIIIVGLSQDGAISRYFYNYGVRSVHIIIITGAGYSIVLSLLLISVLGLINLDREYIFCVGAAFVSATLSAQLSFRQCLRDIKTYLLIQISNAALTTFFVVVFFVFFKPSVIFYFSAVIISGLLSLSIAYYLFFCKFKIRKVNFKNEKRSLLYLFSFGFPLVFHQLSLFAKGQVDRLFVYGQYGLKELGVYSLGIQIATVYSVLIIAVNKAILPYYFNALKTNRLNVKGILKYVYISFSFCFIPALVAFFIPGEWYKTIFGHGFDNVKYFVVFFVFSFGLNIPYLLMVNYFFYIGETSTISKVTFLSSLLYIVILYFLSGIDLKYLPFSLLISNLFMLLLFYKIILNRRAI
ncbi:oligosaccharide flippase family protein [Brenneria corticis]|uniref:Flippase n=1 Tax=Brenneria corticis TaxID=2173106 RepID=A0A2U1TJZ0_9GAMM|nr:oligosaccharide flippase family protein [Brenneria sp. CFCC 11842]PWC09726.1 flippase [Brenneria sp. CFCC 11842]